MELLVILPWLLVIAGAALCVKFARARDSNPPLAKRVILWMIALFVPSALMVAFGDMFAPPFYYGKLAWFLIDNFRLRGGTAGFVANQIWRIIGALVGFLATFVALSIFSPKDVRS